MSLFPGKRSLLCIAIIAIATIFMLQSTWLTWPDAIYDFGSQLYFPWQIIQAKHLYADIAFFNGPLSQYFNAAMFAMFGSSIHVLMTVNFVITLSVVALIYRITLALSDEFSGTAACLVFIFLFAFSRYLGIGNYNWICPYTHEVTHGVALSLAMVLTLGTFLQTSRRRWLVISSILLALVSLTKAEVFAPALIAFLSALVLRARFVGFRGATSAAFCAVVPFASAILIAFNAIAIYTAPAAGRLALLGSWAWVTNTRIGALAFYQRGLGTDQLAGNLGKMLQVGMICTLLLATAVCAGVAPRRWRAITWGVLVVQMAMLLWWWRWSMQIARPWPVFAGGIAVLSFYQAWQTKTPTPALRALLAIFALALLTKMMFNARIAQYGFALAMPSAILLVEAVTGWLPTVISSRGGDGRRVRWATLLLISTITICVYANQLSASRESMRIGSPSDLFLVEKVRGDEIERACENIQALQPPHGTLAVMPQGLMLNFLTRRPNSMTVVNVMPPEVLTIGEDEMIRQLNAHHPDMIVLINSAIADDAFVLADGSYHYGQRILRWVVDHYECKVPADPRAQLGLSIWMMQK